MNHTSHEQQVSRLCATARWVKKKFKVTTLFTHGRAYLEQTNSDGQSDARRSERAFSLRHWPWVSLQFRQQICHRHVTFVHWLQKPTNKKSSIARFGTKTSIATPHFSMAKDVLSHAAHRRRKSTRKANHDQVIVSTC